MAPVDEARLDALSFRVVLDPLRPWRQFIPKLSSNDDGVFSSLSGRSNRSVSNCYYICTFGPLPLKSIGVMEINTKPSLTGDEYPTEGVWLYEHHIN